MRLIEASRLRFFIILPFLVTSRLLAQCPGLPTSSIAGNASPLCEGESVTLSVTGVNMGPGSAVEWYIGANSTFNPYNGEGTLIGTVPVMTDPCNDPPEILYIMVNPDNTLVGGSGDQCDEFMVIWTGSGGFNTSDILVSNLGPGTFMWDGFVAGNATTFSCGTPLPPGPVPANAILIIQSHTTNSYPVNSDALCASGLPVYIIAYDGTGSCNGGYFDNTSGPCSSCPVMLDINGTPCQYDIDLDYMPPASAPNGWAWANIGAGVYNDVIPSLTIPTPGTGGVTIEDFTWTIPPNFCETMGGGGYFITGAIDPPPSAPCPLITTPFYGLEIVCPEMILSGGGDVCEGNCPDAPTEIAFALQGGDTPYEVDLVVTASVFPPFNIPDLPVSDGQTIQVCLGGFFPSFDPGTMTLTVPVLAIGITATVTVVSATSASGCPVDVDPDFITLNFIEGPTVNTGPDQTICSGETVVVSGTMGGSAALSEWTTDGDGDFDDPNELVTTYTPGAGDIANGSVTLTFSATDANSVCLPAEATMAITIEPSLVIDVNSPLTICDNDEAFIVASVTGSTAPCNWETSGDGSFDDLFAASTIYTPGPMDIALGTVTLTFTPIDPDACVESNEPLDITIVAAPDVDIPQNLELCAGDSIVIELNVEGDYTAVNWSSSGDGLIEVTPPASITYTPGPMDLMEQFFVLSVSIQSAFPECGLTTYNMPVNIIDCDCPPLTLTPPSDPLCAENASLDLEDLIVEGGGGSWSITGFPPGANPAMIVGSVFMTNASDPGAYTVTYTLSSPEPGCPDAESITVLVESPVSPFAGMDAAFCGPQNILVNGIVTPMNGSPVMWTTSGDGIFLDENSLNTTYQPGPMDSLAAGLYLVLQVLDDICGVQMDTVTLFFNAPPVLQLTSDTIQVCNTEEFGAVVNLMSAILAGDTGGTWANPSGVGVDISQPDSVNFTGITEGLYVFVYTTNSAASPCAETTDSVVIDVRECLCPLLQVQNPPGGICNNLPSINLDAFIMAGAPGSWQVISSPPGGNPASLTGSFLEVNGKDQGDYTLRFTLNAAPIPGCPDSAEIMLFIQDQPSLTVFGDTSTCGQMPVDVMAILGGSASGITWTSTGLGSFSDPGMLMTIYTPALTDVAAAQVMLMATAIDTFGFCPVPSDTISVFIPTPPSTTFSSLTDTLCNHPDSNSVIDLAGLIIEGDGTGFWTDADGAMVDLSDPSSVDFAGVLPGIYRLIYTTQTALAPCMEAMYTFTVVLEDCQCPIISITDIVPQVCSGDTLSLSTLVLVAEPGVWSITGGPSGNWPSIAIDQLITNNSAPGVYTLTYTLNVPEPGCPESEDAEVQVNAPLSVSVSDIECDATQATYEVIVQTNAASVTSDFGNVTSAGAGAFRIFGIPTGQDIILLLSSGLCTRTYGIAAPDCNCTLFTEDIADTITFCPGDTIVLIPIITGAQGLAFSTWVTPAGTVMRPTLPLFSPGQYVWIVRDSAGCEERDTFNALFIGPQGMSLSTTAPSCEGFEDGAIILLSVEGGTSPYMVSVNNDPPQLINQFPFEIQNVGVGDYTVTVSDMVGCMIDTMVTVEPSTALDIDLGPDVTLIKGDSTLITPVLNGIEPASFAWSPALPGLGLGPFTYSPMVTTSLTLTVTDSAGCVYSDEILIVVIEETTFYIPNIFSPNGDQINDVFEVFSNLPPDQLLSLEIFDRWGSLLFGRYNGGPLQWDGSSSGKEVNSGVYVYKVTWMDEDERIRVTVGDVTVIH